MVDARVVVPSELPSGVAIRALTTLDEVFAASALFAEVWGRDRDPMPAPIMRTLALAGNYVFGLFDGDEMVGASVAFFGVPAARTMHSHVTGVRAAYQGQGLGSALKQHQRAWALARDVGNITWTYDPLSARNAHFSLCALGAKATEYLVNQYGEQYDGLDLDGHAFDDASTDSDRLMVSWALAAPPIPEPPGERVVAAVEIPADIDEIRRTNPADAAAWRLRVREQFAALAADGLVVGGFDHDRGYLFVRRP